MGSLRIKNWESYCFGWSYVFAACCLQPTRWEKWACLPFVYCCNPHVSVHTVQREKRHVPLCSCSQTKDWVCSVANEAKGLCRGAEGSGTSPQAVKEPLAYAALMGLGAGTCRVAIALQLQPCHPLTGHILGRSHGAALCNATTVSISLLTQGLQALHKHRWSPPVFWQNYCHLFHFSGACRRHWTELRSFCYLSALGTRHAGFTACLPHSLNFHRQRGYAWLSPLRGTRH